MTNTKTGTLSFNTMYLHFSPKIVIENPTIINGTEPLMDKDPIRNYPPTK
jgi:hypothetical protein